MDVVCLVWIRDRHLSNGRQASQTREVPAASDSLKPEALFFNPQFLSLAGGNSKAPGRVSARGARGHTKLSRCSMSEIKVTVSNYGRKFLYMRYKDPLTGKNVAKSTGTANMKEAIKIAAKWEAELQEGRYKPASKVTWQEFRERYESEALSALAPNTAAKVAGVFNAIEELVPVDKLVKLDAAQLSRFQKRLRDERQLAESTIKGMLAHLMAALQWGKSVDLLNEVPAVTMPKRVKSGKIMKGRPITLEEFERMLGKVPEVVCNLKPDPEASSPPPEPSESELETIQRWKWNLRGLWFSGLRLGEAVDLSWDELGHITIDLSGTFPMLVIPGEKQKSGEDQILPVAPEFGEMLMSVPFDQRTGRVFKFGRRSIEANPKLLAVSRLISGIGKTAGVLVNRKPAKYASAHDFRRSFGERWSVRVMPATLQQMMRHADISTTMKFYVGADGQKAAAEIHAAFARHLESKTSTSGNTQEKTTPEASTELTQDTSRE